MFERFNDDGRRVVVLAQEEARLLNHNFIGTEHILLALLRARGTVAARALESLDISLAVARAQVIEAVGSGGTEPSGHIPFTPRAKKVLELSLREALQLGHNYIGCEHVLLGLLREGDGVAAEILVKLGADLQRVRARVFELVEGGRGEAQPASAQLIRPVATAIAVAPGRCAFCDRDLWDVEHYVRGEIVAICDACIELSSQTVAGAAVGERALDLPPRISGTEIDDADAPAAIVKAFQVVFAETTEARAEHLEDGARIDAYMEAGPTRVPAGMVEAVRVSRIRFSRADTADVRFSLVLRQAPAGLLFEGQAVRRAGRWMVSRDTFAQMVARIGIQLPPPE